MVGRGGVVGYASSYQGKYPTMLTDMEVKAAKASDKAKKLFDSNGLYLLVTLGYDGKCVVHR